MGQKVFREKLTQILCILLANAQVPTNKVIYNNDALGVAFSKTNIIFTNKSVPIKAQVMFELPKISEVGVHACSRDMSELELTQVVQNAQNNFNSL